MNIKVENSSGAGLADYAKYGLALLIAVAGLAAFYLLPQWPAVIRGLSVFFAFALALVVFGFTAKGLVARKFFADSLFELRKVVWPTREETLKITGLVLIVVAIISLVLSGFDLGISTAIKWLLGA
jgi:preprotein translocase subunit SecE